MLPKIVINDGQKHVGEDVETDDEESGEENGEPSILFVYGKPGTNQTCKNIKIKQSTDETDILLIEVLLT